MKTSDIKLRYWYKNSWMRNYIIANADDLGIHTCASIVKIDNGYYASLPELSPTFPTLTQCKKWVIDKITA